MRAMANTDDHITEDLQAFLGANGTARATEGCPGDAGERLVVERVLRETPDGSTRLVRRSSDGGLFVHKVAPAAPGAERAYLAVMRAQRAGKATPHLPQVERVEMHDGILDVLTEYAPGESLRELVERTPAALRPHLACAVFPEVCSAAAELHEGLGEPLVHRDLTPANVIVDPEDLSRVTIVDLGIARVWREGAEADTSHFGTRPYAPPEQFGFGQTDVRTDVYALGMTLFFMLAGRDPTPHDRDAGYAVPGVPETLRAVVARAGELDPAARPASARELADAFARAMGATGTAGAGGPAGAAGPAGGFATGGSPGGMPGRAPGGAPAALASRHAPTASASGPAPVPTPLARIGRVVGAVWNVVVLLCAGGMVATGISLGLDPQSRSTHSDPPWLDTVGYLVFMNVLVLAVALLLLRRGGLPSRLGFLATRRARQTAVTVVLGDFALLVVLVWVAGKMG